MSVKDRMEGYWQIDRWFRAISHRQIGKILEDGGMDGFVMSATDRMERYWQMDRWISDICHRHKIGEYWQMDSFYCSYLLAEEVIP